MKQPGTRGIHSRIHLAAEDKVRPDWQAVRLWRVFKAMLKAFLKHTACHLNHKKAWKFMWLTRLTIAITETLFRREKGWCHFLIAGISQRKVSAAFALCSTYSQLDSIQCHGWMTASPSFAPTLQFYPPKQAKLIKAFSLLAASLHPPGLFYTFHLSITYCLPRSAPIQGWQKALEHHVSLCPPSPLNMLWEVLSEYFILQLLTCWHHIY